MKLLSIISKSLKEQIRSFWILLLTISMAPFFVAVYFLILESYQPRYDILVLNHDRGIEDSTGYHNHGQMLIEAAQIILSDSSNLPFKVKKTDSRENAIQKLKNRKADAFISIPGNFSTKIYDHSISGENINLSVEFVGDLTNIEYMISAVWANAAINQYMANTMKNSETVNVTETSLGVSGNISDFELMVPGLLTLALIMLMFSATIAIVAEVENKTIMRLKLSGLSTFEFLSGVSIVQIAVGLVSIILTLAVAMSMGFSPEVSALWILIFIAILTSISIFAFSLILAAVTKTVNEVLIIGNFPLFLFMFFTGAAFPIEGKALFSISGYSISIQGLMSPTHAISALKKVLIMEMNMTDIIPEIISILILSVLYFAVGVLAFKRMHMRIE